jgi:hypothetical protein
LPQKIQSPPYLGESAIFDPLNDVTYADAGKDQQDDGKEGE